MKTFYSADPKAISERGVEIYAERYKQRYEQEHFGKFLAVNVLDGSATLGDTSSAALLEAKKASPSGLFHLIRVGYPAAFGMSLTHRNVPSNRVH